MKIRMPGQNVPLQLSDGTVEPLWYAFFKQLTQRGVLDLPDVDNSTPITNGQVLVYDSTAQKLKPELIDMSFLGDLFGGDAGKQAAQQNTQLYNNYQQQGQQYLNNGYNTATGYLNQALGAYSPLQGLAQQYSGSVDTLNNALGVNGASGAQAGADAFKNSIYGTVSDQAGLDAINRRRAAAGMLNSGNADQDAQTFETNLVNGQIGNWLSNLGGLSSNALSATNAAAQGQAGVYGGLGTLATNNASDLTNLLGTTTSGLASANNQYAAAEDAGAKNLLGLGTSLLGLGTGGGATVGGSLLKGIGSLL